MKILILANSSSGLYSFRKELISRLLLDNEVIAITPDSGSWMELEEMGCKLFNIPIDRRGINLIADMKLMYRYLSILRREKPELVITYTIKPNIYGGIVCRFLNIPYAMNITGLGTAFERGGILTKFVTILYKIACKKAKVVFFENSANKGIFLEKKIIVKEQACLLNGAGVNLEKYPLAEYPREETIKFLFVGRVMEEKGINELLRAMKRLISDGVKAELHVLGEYEEDYKELIETYEQEGWIHYHGYQKDVRPFIHTSHCFVLPSWHEGMANTNLECAASGRPVITSNIPGCKEAVIDGVSGYLSERKNAENLYCVMKKFIQLSYEDRKEMGIKGRKHMEKYFDKKIIVKETIGNLI